MRSTKRESDIDYRCDNFSGVYFDSYKDDSLLVDFMEKLHCKLSFLIIIIIIRSTSPTVS